VHFARTGRLLPFHTRGARGLGTIAQPRLLTRAVLAGPPPLNPKPHFAAGFYYCELLPRSTNEVHFSPAAHPWPVFGGRAWTLLTFAKQIVKFLK